MLYVLVAVVALLILTWLALAYWAAGLLLHGRRRPLTGTPRDYGLAYEDVSFCSKDGIELRGWWIEAAPAAAEGQAAAVILLHPLFGNRQGDAASLDLLALARCWCAAGYTVLMFDFRNHGQSQAGQGAGGYSEDQDAAGAVDYVFGRLASETPGQEPQVGVVGFGLGASAAIAAIGREKGDSRTIRVFSADQEGSSGFIEFPPADVKKLRFLVAVEPAAPAELLRGGCRLIRGPLGPLLLPLVDRFCRLRGGYPLDGALLVRFARHIHTPVLYVHAARTTEAASPEDGSEARLLCVATSGPKQLWRIAEPLDAPAIYAHAARHADRMLAFAAGQVGENA